MSLFGTASGNTLKGQINRLTELRGYSAYELALIHGFEGTEEEWLESMVEGAVTFNGRSGYVLPEAGDYTAAMVGADKAGAAAAVSNHLAQQINAKVLMTSISLTTDWTGEESPYFQTVTVPDMTDTKMVDLQPSPEQVNTLMGNGTVGLQAVNDNGTVIVYAFGEKPAEAMTIQAIITDLNDIQGGGWEDDDEGDDPVTPDEPVVEKLSTPVIRLEIVSDNTGDDDTGEDDTGDDTGEDDTEENTPAILGVAVLGRTILGDYGDVTLKLGTPVISLVTDDTNEDDGEDEPVLEQLDTPTIRLEVVEDSGEDGGETVVLVLDAPEIELVEV